MNTVTVKDFGKNTKCHSLESLRNTLKERYTRKSVAIINTLKDGINKTFFVTVREDGSLVETYGKQKEVPLNTFNF